MSGAKSPTEAAPPGGGFPPLSPFRYPGGKTWLIPYARAWLRFSHPKLLIDPFCGGGSVPLAALQEGFVQACVLVELDPAVAAVWQTMLEPKQHKILLERILKFRVTRKSVEKTLQLPVQSGLARRTTPTEICELAFRTILRNRTQYGGFMSPGSGLLRIGDGRGLRSRWYPDTLAKRIRRVHELRTRITFCHGDGFVLGPRYCSGPDTRDTAFLLDPPYIGAKRMYSFAGVDPEKVMRLAATLSPQNDFLMTYDAHPAILRLAHRYRIPHVWVPMHTTRHEKKWELLLSNYFGWLNGSALQVQYRNPAEAGNAD